MKRVSFFVDGFNLYYSIKSAIAERKCSEKIKWLDITHIFCQKLNPLTEIIGDIYYFTAIFPSRSDTKSMNRHTTLIKAYESKGIEVIKGRF